jgi:hypothetical protein
MQWYHPPTAPKRNKEEEEFVASVDQSMCGTKRRIGEGGKKRPRRVE